MMPSGLTAQEWWDVGMENERAGGWVSEPQGERKKSSSTLETQCALVVLVVVVIIGVHVLERGTVRHSPTFAGVQWTMNSTILRQWVERLVHGAPLQSFKWWIPFRNIRQQFTDKTVQYAIVWQTPPSLFSFNLVTNVFKGRVQSLKYRCFTFCLFRLFSGSRIFFPPERHRTN